MADEIVDRGDEIIVDESLGDEAGDTADGKQDVKGDAGKDEADKGEADKGEADKGDDKGITIPKARFDQAVGKARAAEKVAQEKADKLEAELAASRGTVDYEKVEAEIDALEDKLEEAIKDGNVEAKQRIRKEIRAKNGQLTEAKAAAYSQYATAVAVEQIRYDAAVERMEIEHPELNPDHDSYDAEKVAEVAEYKRDAEAAGKASTIALKQALKAVYGNAAPKAKEKADDKPEAKKDDKPEAKDLKEKADAEGAKRKEEAVKRGLDTKGKQPSNDKAGIDSDKAGKTAKSADVNKMSDKDFDKLDEEELKRLRGDDA